MFALPAQPSMQLKAVLTTNPQAMLVVEISTWKTQVFTGRTEGKKQP
jgi:hypothetical protein